LFNDTVSHSEYIVLNKWMMMNLTEFNLFTFRKSSTG
jgi:hypothetical protein